MGIEIQASAEIPRKGWFGKRPDKETLFAQIRSSVESSISDPLLREMVSFRTDVHTLSITLHPMAGLDLTWAPTRLEAYVKTSAAGPGLHAFACDLLKEIERACNLRWNWPQADETGYAASGDFDALQRQTAAFLRTLGDSLLQHDCDGWSDATLNWPLDTPRPHNQAFAVSPLGKWPKDWWQRVVRSNDRELRVLAEQFFPWWHKQQDAQFWLNAGLALLWADVPWHHPVNDDEVGVCRRALSCFDRARTLDPAMPLPEEEIIELAAILEREPEEPPRQAGIGFRRYPMTFDLPGDWSIVLPGYFHHTTEDNGEQEVFWFNGRTVRATAMTVSGSRSADELLPRKPEHPEVTCSPLPHLKGKAGIALTHEDGEEYWMLQGCMATFNALCVVSVCYDDPNDRQWAIETFKSVSHPPPQEQ